MNRFLKFVVIIFLAIWFMFTISIVELEDVNNLKEIEIQELRIQVEKLEEEVKELETEIEELSVIEEVEVIVATPIVEEVIDYRWEALVSTTFRLETGNGTSGLWLNRNNPGGIKCGSEYCHYNSPNEGLRALELLLERYVADFGYDFVAIRNRYSESDDIDLFMRIYHEEMRSLREDI